VEVAEVRTPVDLVRAIVDDGDASSVEGLLVVGLDRDGGRCGVAVYPRHRALSFVKVWELHALAAELEAQSLVVALFPRGGTRSPTPHEEQSFAELRARAHRAGVDLADCIVVRGGHCWSMRERRAPS
jgi:hypothetical protein